MRKLWSGLICLLLLCQVSVDAGAITPKKKRSALKRSRTHHTRRVPRHHQVVEQKEPEEKVVKTMPPATPGWAEKFEVTWKKGLNFKSKDGDYSLNARITLVPRYEYNGLDNKEDQNTFRVRRGNLTFAGNVFSKKLFYKFKLNFVTSKVDEVFEDAYLDYRFNDAFGIEFGQFKIPYNRQQISASEKLQFPDRSLASDEFRFAGQDVTTTCTLASGEKITGVGISCSGGAVKSDVYSSRRFNYDPGLMFHGELFNKKLEYAAAITNGSGYNRLNLNKDFLYSGRLVWNALGNHGYSESDVERSEKPALFLGVSGGYNVRDYDKLKVTQAGAETGFKYKGLSVLGEYFFRNNRTVAGVTTRDHGYYAQAGYFIVPKHFEVAARASQIFFDGPSNNKSEFSAGLNYYFIDHDLKIQADYSYLPEQATAGTVKNHRARLQFQAWF